MTDEIGRYLDLVGRMWARDPGQREGQVFYNALRTGWPGLELEIRGTELDPFTLDQRLPAFLAWVERRLAAPREPG